MLGYALRMRLVLANPVEGIENPRPSRRELPIYDAGQVKLLLRAAEGKRLAALFVVACSTGRRQGELLGLAWYALDLVAGVVHVRQTLTQVKGEFKLKPPRSKAAVPQQPFHSLRPSHASALLSNGESIRAVAKRLRHAGPTRTLRVYAHVLPDEDSRLAERSQPLYG